jgi:DNA gyrase/topoisomerase IV subunit B
MFPEYEFQVEYIEKRLWMYAFLNSGLSLYFNGQRYYSKNGLRDLIDAEVDEDRIYDILHYKDKTLEFAFSHTSNYGETYFSFVNGQHTNDGGTHLSAFREGVLKAVNEFSGKSYTGNDVRDGIVGSIAIKLQDPVFESQTKNKLGNSDIRGWIVNTVKQAVVDYLHRHLDESELLLGKVALNEKVRKEIQAVKKQSREKAKKMNLKIPKLKDCKHHFGDGSKYSDDTMVFLTEGQSAAGAMVSCRDVMTQAIFSLKGKPLNCFGEKIDKVYQNEELYFIMQTLNIEDDLEGLRYNKVVIATDSDVDGLHIRNLLITFFLTFYEPLVLSGHLYILETPLFRARNKNETIYCYSESERDEAVAKLGGHAKGVEVTRFKGLGEISPDEFGQFIGEDIKLVTVTVDHMRDIPEMLNFYMGKNTPQRKEHIMNNLV